MQAGLVTYAILHAIALTKEIKHLPSDIRELQGQYLKDY